MRVGFAELLAQARATGDAVVAFSCHDLAQAHGVLDAAECRGRGVILLLPSEVFRSARGEATVAAFNAAAEVSSAPACVQLDHLGDLKTVKSGLQAGARAVMVDGAGLTPEENTRFVIAAAKLARRFGAEVECELGSARGGENLPYPAQAGRLLLASGASCFAPTIGNAHGHYRERPELDLELLARIRAETGDRFLSLHGGSGIPANQLRAAITAGVAKVNVNTELRDRYLGALRAIGMDLGKAPYPGDALVVVGERLRDSMRGGAEAVYARLEASPAGGSPDRQARS